jgi:hypothetical protein
MLGKQSSTELHPYPLFLSSSSSFFFGRGEEVAVLQMESRALQVLGKYSTTEWYPSPTSIYIMLL